MPLSKEDIFKFDFGAAVLNGFKNTVFGIFNKYSHINKKYIPANKEPFITKELHKAIMKISKLRNNFEIKNLSLQESIHVTAQFFGKVIKKYQKLYFNNLYIVTITDN